MRIGLKPPETLVGFESAINSKGFGVIEVIKDFILCLDNMLHVHIYQNYGQTSNGNRSRLMEERAPSTAEEFQRVAEEKAKEAKESVATQNVDKSYEGAIGDSKVESVKNRYT